MPMNQNQTTIATRLIQSAAHITAVTKCNDPLGSLDKISDAQFEKISGVPKTTWKKIVENSGTKWIEAFKGQYTRSKSVEDRRLNKMFGLL
jgi:hypothetical protein